MKEKIMLASVEEFNHNGVKFTLDAVCNRLKISKKTIYKYFKNKEDIIEQTIDYYLNLNHQKQEEIFKTNLDVISKIRTILISGTEFEKNIAFEKINELEETYPTIYKRFNDSYLTHWDNIDTLLSKARQLKLIKSISNDTIINIIQTMMISIHSNHRLNDNYSYKDAINDIVDIILGGIVL